MTEMQVTFLYYTFIYFLIKGGLYVALYVATILVEKNARDRYAMLRVYLKEKREKEQVRWKVAYDKLNKGKQVEQRTLLSKAS